MENKLAAIPESYQHPLIAVKQDLEYFILHLKFVFFY